MLFWIILALIVAVAAYLIWDYGDWTEGIGVVFVGGIVGTIVLFLCAVFIPANVDLVHEKTSSLKALGTSSNDHGRFFLGSGYIDGKRVLNYIQQGDDGGMRVAQVDAKDALIFEGSDKATITTKHFDFNNGWIIPWPIGSTDKYEFRIPDGSVTESFTIANE